MQLAYVVKLGGRLMSVRWWFALVAVLAITLTYWGRDKNWTDCESKDWNARKRGCTAIVEDVTESSSRVWQAYIHRGRAFEKMDNLELAIKDYDKAIRMFPDRPNAYLLRGYAFSEKGDVERAIADINKGVVLGPENADPLIVRGNFYIDRNQLEPAISDFRRALALEPKNAFALTGLGYAYFYSDRIAEAISNFDLAIAIEPEFEPAFAGRGAAYLTKRDFDKALADLNKAIALEPSDSYSYHLRSQVRIEIGEQVTAIKDANQAIALEPRNAEFLNGRCFRLAIVGMDLDQARADCDAALAIENDHNTLDSRGLVGLKQGRFDEAWKDYDTALRMAPSMASYLFGRGIAALRLGRTAEGNADLAAATKLNGKIAEEYARYGVLP